VNIDGFIEYKTLDLRDILEMKPNLKIRRENLRRQKNLMGISCPKQPRLRHLQA